MICPACYSANCYPVDSFSVTQPYTGFFPDTFNLYSCTGCGLWFKDYATRILEVGKYYDGLKVFESNWNYQQRLPHEKRIDDLLAKLPPGSFVLDVGCWTGRLLSKHVHLQRFGIEPNSVSAGIAESQGLKIIGSDVSSLNDFNKTFDLILLIDVFEHLPHPLQILDLLICRLNHNGKLIIITGRTDCVPVQLAKSTYWYFSKNSDHLVFLNHKFIKWLCKKYLGHSIRVKPVRHYNFRVKRFIYEIFWLVSWRFFNPNSPFKKIAFSKYGFLTRLSNVKEITMCTNWKDHYMVEIYKL